MIDFEHFKTGFLELISEYFANMFVSPTPAVFFPYIVGFFLVFFFIRYYKAVKPQEGTAEWITRKLSKPELSFLFTRFPMEKKDIAPLLLITAFFLILAVFNLGGFNIVDVTNEIREPAVERTHFDNLYFDEVYHVRTAVEHLENLNPYEISHPPVGKEIIAASIVIFGMSPFGWRIAGAVFGILMLVVMYIFVKNMFGKTSVAACATLLFGFDFMRFVQTRLATIDSFSVLFILLAFFFMYRYMTTDKDAPFRSSLLSLALCGIFFGLSVAVKWTGFYAGAGLFIMYCLRLAELGAHYRSTKEPGYGKYLVKTLLFSLLFFIILPSIVYYISYIPYGTARGMTVGGGMLWSREFFDLVWSNQIFMFNYHSNLVAEHSFSSTWWQWIINARPILYVHRTIGDLRATFGAFGNPVISWGGFIAMIIMAIRTFTHRDGKALLILIGYLSQLLPWVAVSRIVFAYHYFPSTLFLILALAHLFNTFIERSNISGQNAAYGYVTVSGLVFALFYPSLSGMFIPVWYYKELLKWFPSWPF